MKVSESSGRFLVTLARIAIENFLSEGEKSTVPSNAPSTLLEKAGAFCTLNLFPNGDLRGCIGRILPQQALIEALIDSAIDAAVHDPRFPSVSLEEMDNIAIEVTILTPPESIWVNNAEEYLKKIQIGTHGLIAQQGIRKGLLLPQVPVDHNWDIFDFLSHTCTKAGLPPDAWMDLRNTHISSFEGILFAEEKPRGKIVQRFLKE